MFTFLHVADVHLDSPLKNLELQDRDLARGLRSASRQAFDNLIRLAIENRVAFILFSGDLFDGTWKDFNTGLFFLDRMRQLRQQGIRVFLIAGNHDAASQISKALHLPDNVHRFGSRRPTSVHLPEYDTVLHGWSYGQRAVRINLASQYPDPEPGLLNIGLLHTALTGRPGHQPYAPCTREELIARGYDYWALGHVHRYEEICRDPWIVFSGMLQGRHIGETAAGGAVLVRVDNGRVVSVRHEVLDVVRWSRCRLDTTDLEEPGQILTGVENLLHTQQEKVGSRSLAIRLHLTGRCPCFSRIMRDEEHWREELIGLAMDCGDIWFEQIRFDLLPPRNQESAGRDDPLAWLRSRMEGPDPPLQPEDLAPGLEQLASRLPPESRRENNPLPQNPEEAEQLLAEARRLLQSRIDDQ